MTKGNFILKIRTSYNQFTKAEKKVADYVLEHPKEVLYMSITDLADACKVGETSVYRFCRTMDLQGYQEFKMKLSLSISDAVTKPVSYVDSQTDSFSSIVKKILDMHISALKETQMLLNVEEFQAVLELFEDAERVYFFGIGDSMLAAEEARNKFLRLTGKVFCVADPHMQAMTAATMTKKDLLIIVSYSGSTKDNIHVAKIAKKNGAKIACITHFRKSPLTAYCDGILLSGSNEGPLDGGSTSGKISQMFLIDLLYQEYYRRNYKISNVSNKKTSAAVLEKMY